MKGRSNMSVAIKAEEIYARIYVDCKLKLFTLTGVPLKRPTHLPIVAPESALMKLKESLVDQGYTWVTRQLFESKFN